MVSFHVIPALLQALARVRPAWQGRGHGRGRPQARGRTALLPADGHAEGLGELQILTVIDV